MSESVEFLILNNQAAANEALRAAINEYRRNERKLFVRVSWESGDAARYTREAMQQGAVSVIAAGGDGTLNEAADAMLSADAGEPPVLGLLPTGTANDFATACGLPADPVQALEMALNGPVVAIDAVRAGTRHFVNMASGGFGTEVTAETPGELKNALGAAAYFLTGLTRFDSIRAACGEFRAPEFEWSGNFLVLALGNGRQAGGGHVLCPEALIDDGLLDVSILPEPAEGSLLDAALAYLGRGNTENGAITARVPWLEIDAPEGLNLNLDGEPARAEHLRIEVLPGALRMRLPQACALLGGG